MTAHAILSPSGAERWLSCPPSARLEEQFPDSAGDAAKEGTLAHSLGELLIQQKMGMLSKKDFAKAFKEIEAAKFYNNAMLDHTDNYATFVMERYSEAKTRSSDAVMLLERKVDLTEFVPDGFGTIDNSIIADHILDITDLKYGKGVPVSSVKNKQMMLYGLGAYREYELLYDIRLIRMTIFQPRLDTISTWEISVEDLLKWAEEELKPRAKLAFDGVGDFTPGTHCRFCKARAVCKANAAFQLEIAKHEFKSSELLEDSAISDILDRADAFRKWLTAVEEHALSEAVNKGKKWPGYKLVEGRSNRAYTSQTDVARHLLNSGFSEAIIYEKSLLGITAMEKAIGKGKFNELLADLIVKPQGKPTLAPLDDKRPEYNGTESAINDFK